ncbi:MAG: PHP domain-containing protein [Tissierellia bacterium]|nr:PHP domain-containing protein [Tissierellia bacterium]
MNELERIEFNVRTQLSDGPGINSVDEYIERAAELGHKAIAITDLNGVQSFKEAEEAGEKYGIKIIYGIEMEVIDVERIETQDYLDKYGYNTTKLTYPEILPKSYNMTIYVKNQKGLSILYKLISEAYTELFYEKQE